MEKRGRTLALLLLVARLASRGNGEQRGKKTSWTLWTQTRFILGVKRAGNCRERGAGGGKLVVHLVMSVCRYILPRKSSLETLRMARSGYSCRWRFNDENLKWLQLWKERKRPCTQRGRAYSMYNCSFLTMRYLKIDASCDTVSLQSWYFVFVLCDDLNGFRK